MQDDVLSELRKRISDPEELAKFERFHRLYAKRMERLGPDAGPTAMVEATMRCWRRAFGVEWPATKPPPKPLTAADVAQPTGAWLVDPSEAA